MNASSLSYHIFLKKIGSEVGDYRIYCLFREPVDWLFSWYRFRTRAEVSPENAPGHWEYTGGMSWGEFLEETLKKKPPLFANLHQHKFVEGLDGTTKGLTLFRYAEIDQFLIQIKQKVGQDFDLVNWNVSPTVEGGPTKEDFDRCRVELAADYRVYDRIGIVPDKGASDHLDAAAGNGLISNIKRKIFS